MGCATRESRTQGGWKHVFRARVHASITLATTALACSLTPPELHECDANRQCMATFGLGSTCDDGYCTPPELHPRCSRAFPERLLTAPAEYADHVLLGSIYSFTDHLDTLQATELAVRQVNDASGLEGTRYAILHCDYTPMAGDALDDIAATEAVTRFMAERLEIPAIIGPRGSARAEAAYNAMRSTDAVLISPSATSTALTALDGTNPTFEQPGHLWRTAPPDDLQSEVIADDMAARGITNAAVLYQSGAYGDGLKSLFVRRFSEAGGTAAEFPFSAGSDFSGTVADLAEAVQDQTYQDVLFISSDINDYVGFLNAAGGSRTLEEAYLTEGVGIFLTDAAYSPQLIADTVDLSAPLFAKIRGTRPAPATGPLFDAFAAAYAAAYSQDATSSAFTPHSYDAAWLILYATAWSYFNEGEITGTGIARGLRKLSDGKAVEIEPISWNTVIDEFKNGRGIDVEGASGPLDYDPATEETSAPISVWSIVEDPGVPSGYDFSELDRIDPE